MECVKFTRKENPKDKHDKEGKEERDDVFFGSGMARGWNLFFVIGSFNLYIILLFGIQYAARL